MALDVKRNPDVAVTTVTWYRTADTTPFAVAGDDGGIGSMLVATVAGHVREAWFSDNGWEWPDGKELNEEHIYAFAFMPEVPNAK